MDPLGICIIVSAPNHHMPSIIHNSNRPHQATLALTLTLNPIGR